jgi:hypothetical protein
MPYNTLIHTETFMELTYRQLVTILGALEFFDAELDEETTPEVRKELKELMELITEGALKKIPKDT